MFQTTQKSDSQKNESDERSKPLSSKLDPSVYFHVPDLTYGAAEVAQLKEEEELQKKEATSPVAQRMVEEEEEKAVQGKSVQGQEEEELQMKASSNSLKEGTNSSGTTVRMPEEVQAKMEGSFGTSFSDVNIHSSDNSATHMGALAYTQGNNVHFAPGQYNPNTSKGQELLGHELTHVVQQRQGRVQPTKQGKGMPVNDNPSLENEADVMGKMAAEGKRIQRKSRLQNGALSGDNTIQRTPETFKVPSGWGLNKIAEHLDITVEELKEANQDKLKTWGDVQGFNSGEVIIVPAQTPVAPIETTEQKIDNAYNDYKSGKTSMPDFARILLPFVSTHASKILTIFDSLPWEHRDNLAYALAINSDDSKLAALSEDLLIRMKTELGGVFNTTSWTENWAQKDRIVNILGGNSNDEKAKEEDENTASADLEFMRGHFNNNLSGDVGSGKENVKADVKHVARGLKAKGYDVPSTALNDGICDDAFIEVIKKFQTEVQGTENPDGAVDAKGTTIKKIFDKANNSFSSGLNNMFGQWAGILNESLEGNPLKAWKRTEAFNSSTNQYDYTIKNNDFIDQATYLEHIKELAEAKGVEEDSGNAKALGMAAKAASDNAYFNEITKDVGFELSLSNESVGSHQVNSVLKDRLTRFHKFLSAVGLFRGNMTGSACRDAAYAHRICVAHVVIGSVRPQASKDSVRNNLVKVYNGETVAGGTKDSNGNILDSDNHVWAKSEHFNKNDSGVATSMKDDVWFPHLKTPQPSRNWDVYTAEGYKKGDSKRFPLGLNAIPGRSNHITGDAIDINYGNFSNMNDAMLDLIALNFGLIRPVPGEQWHFECTNVQISSSEKALVDANTRESLEKTDI